MCIRDRLTDGFPSDPYGAALAYAQSADFILWLRGEWGQDAIRTLIQDCIHGRPLKHALATLTDVQFETLDKMWTNRLANRSAAWSNPANVEMLLWGFCGVLLLGGGLSRKLAFRRRMAAWQEEEDGIERLAAALLRRRRG